jgi:very-short-patch-repair endonuclease
MVSFWDVVCTVGRKIGNFICLNLKIIAKFSGKTHQTLLNKKRILKRDKPSINK